jgi:hypothetical protein
MTTALKEHYMVISAIISVVVANGFAPNARSGNLAGT